MSGSTFPKTVPDGYVVSSRETIFGGPRAVAAHAPAGRRIIFGY